MTSKKQLSEPNDVLYRIKRGLAGYISYLAACEMNEAFNEYVLYEPILRILTARRYSVKCEVLCPGVPQPKKGDKRKLDFIARLQKLTCAIEVKWARKTRIMLDRDLEKLSACLSAEPKWRAFLFVFGRKSVITELILPQNLRQVGHTIIAEFEKTSFGCRVYEVAKQIAPPTPSKRGTAKSKVKRRLSQNT
ncbi:MAG: hypothetical protein ACLP72_09710 [Candidatus Sulfotelmatobacter sp.]